MESDVTIGLQKRTIQCFTRSPSVFVARQEKDLFFKIPLALLEAKHACSSNYREAFQGRGGSDCTLPPFLALHAIGYLAVLILGWTVAAIVMKTNEKSCCTCNWATSTSQQPTSRLVGLMIKPSLHQAIEAQILSNLSSRLLNQHSLPPLTQPVLIRVHRGQNTQIWGMKAIGGTSA
eukprot:768254-Hanusia_phi.AAC.1